MNDFHIAKNVAAVASQGSILGNWLFKAYK